MWSINWLEISIRFKNKRDYTTENYRWVLLFITVWNDKWPGDEKKTADSYFDFSTGWLHSGSSQTDHNDDYFN